jgi:hypothetical protein
MSDEGNIRKVRAPRQRVLKTGQVVMMDRWLVIDCTIRDISATGAKLVCGDQTGIPNEFRFYIPTENTICTARVVWRKDQMLGIEFTSAKIEAPRQTLMSSKALSVA